MSKIEDLVPPLELCKQIPDGIFSDSAFWRVWSAVEQRYILCQRGTGAFINAVAIPCPCGMRYIYPAPTLEEIMRYTGRRFDVQFEDEWWFAESGSNAFSGATATIAALNLLFEVRGWQG